ncbi:MAG: hypothetical protein K0U41_06660 [Gammaproteobacteria bacterium]|nr:hypothetical protein [Gammaproteobacteria bacterium]
MPAYRSSSVNLITDSGDAYDNYLGKIVAGGVVANQRLSPLIVAANRDNPSRRQVSFNEDILRDFPQYIPQAIETIIETPNQYAKVKASFDYIIDTELDREGSLRLVASTISPTLQRDRESLGDTSFSATPLQRLRIWRTTAKPFKYIIPKGDFHNPPNSHAAFDALYDVPYAKIKERLTQGEYVNLYIAHNYPQYYAQDDWPPNKTYTTEANGDILIEIGQDLINPNIITVRGYNPTDIYTFVEYMAVVDSLTNCVRRVFAYNHSAATNRDSVLDQLLLPTLRDELGDPLTGKFYPIIPMRRNNISTKSQIPSGVKDLFDSKYNLNLDEHFDKIETNGSIGEIDDMYLVHGIPLNSKKQSHKRYIFEFFNLYLEYSNNLKLTIQNDGFVVKIFSNIFGKTIYTTLTAAQEALVINDVVITSAGSVTQITKRFKDRVETINITELSHTTITGDDGTITILAQTALADAQHDEFMLPLHAPTIERLTPRDRISLSGADLYFVVNSYGFISREWWEPILEVFIVALQASAVLASILFPPTGLLGKLSSVVVSGLAVTGTTAIITGAIVNTVAAALVGKAIIRAGSKALGTKEAVVLAAVVSLVLTRSGSNPFQSWTELNNLAKGNLITNALSDIHSITVENRLSNIRQEDKDLREATDNRLAEIQKKLDEITPNNSFSPIYQAIAKSHLFYEEPESFLNRTTLVGSDLVELNDNIVKNYVDNSLELSIIGTNRS